MNNSNAKFSIIIPAYNEAQAIGSVLQELEAAKFPWLKEIIVVDDCSTDHTAAIVEKASSFVTLLRNKNNRGYGASLKRGIHHATSDYIITMDADGQHKLKDLVNLVESTGDADMVIGARKGMWHSPAWRMPGKYVLKLLAESMIRQKIPDLNSGLRVVDRKVCLRYLHLCPSGFSLSTTLTMAILSRGYKVSFVEINVQKRIGHSTVNIMTGIETIFLILRLSALFWPLRLFVPASIFLFLVGLLWGIPYVIMGRGVSTGTLLFVFTSINVFALGILCDQISQTRLERYE